jgi:hypothetical protein
LRDEYEEARREAAFIFDTWCMPRVRNAAAPVVVTEEAEVFWRAHYVPRFVIAMTLLERKWVYDGHNVLQAAAVVAEAAAEYARQNGSDQIGVSEAWQASKHFDCPGYWATRSEAEGEAKGDVQIMAFWCI